MKIEDLHWKSEEEEFLIDERECSLRDRLEQMYELLNRLGGEVCRLKANVDGLNEDQQVLLNAFQKLRQVIHEKGVINMDDFDLACEVYEEQQQEVASRSMKKVIH